MHEERKVLKKNFSKKKKKTYVNLKGVARTIQLFYFNFCRFKEHH